MGLLTGILRGLGVIALCFAALHFGRAQSWWAFGTVMAGLAALMMYLALEAGAGVAGLGPIAIYVGLAAAFCAFRMRSPWAARI